MSWSSSAMRTLPWIGLGIYSVVLVGLEALGKTELARHLCTDIIGPIRFYAVNTSLSVGLLLGGALLLLFAAAVVEPPPPRAERRFLLLQAALLLYLGLDDRFLLHETIGGWLHVEDALVLCAVGVVELILLWRLGALRRRSPRARACLVLAALMFAVMTAIDGLLQGARGFPRLTLEDVAKTWSAAFLFGFAWEIAAGTLRAPGLGAERSA